MLNKPPDSKPPSQTPRKPDQQIQLRIPFVSPVFTLVMLLVLVMLALTQMTRFPDNDKLLPTLSVQGTAVLESLQVYRVAGSLLLVAPVYRTGGIALNLIAVAVSVYTLYIVGTGAEPLWGHLRFALVYVLAGMAAVLVSLVLVGAGAVPAGAYLVGAPGAILATLGADVVYLYRHRKLYRRRGRQRQLFLGGLVLVNLVVGAFVPYIDLFGLVGGLLAGALLAWYIAPLHMLRQHPDDPAALLSEDTNPLRTRFAALAVYATALVGLLALGVSLMR